jgi:serine/threonine-protein kinase
MSPEQAFGEKDVDYRSDIWSLGILVYKCLAGTVPTYADNVGQILKIILSDKIPLLSEKVPGTPEDIVLLVRKMLQLDRHERPADLREVQAVLARYAPNVTVPAFGPAIIPPPRSSSRLPAGSDSRLPTSDTVEDRDTVRASFDRTKRIIPISSSTPATTGNSAPLSETSVGVQVADPRSINVAPGSPWRTRIAVAAGVVTVAAGAWVIALRTAHPVAAARIASGEPVSVAAALPPLPAESGLVVGSGASAGTSAGAPPGPDAGAPPRANAGAGVPSEVGMVASARPAAPAVAKKVKPVVAAPVVTATSPAAAPNPNTNNGKFVEKPPF